VSAFLSLIYHLAYEDCIVHRFGSDSRCGTVRYPSGGECPDCSLLVGFPSWHTRMFVFSDLVHSSYSCLRSVFLSLTITGSIVNFSKVTVGRPRPGNMPNLVSHPAVDITPSDLISRCMPKPGSVDPTFGLSTSDICTQTDVSLMEDGFRSFLSGHAGCKLTMTTPCIPGVMIASFPQCHSLGLAS
jgi:hypothetical protein